MKSSQLLKYTALGLFGLIALLIVWSFIEPRTLNTKTATAKIPNLPDSWQNKRIGQISDFQIGIWGDNRNTARRSVAELIEAEPAVALISGDFIPIFKSNERLDKITKIKNTSRCLEYLK